MSNAHVESMSDRLTERLATIAVLLNRLAIGIPAPDHMGALDIPAAQRSLFGAQRHVEDITYMWRYGVTGTTSVDVSVMINEWLAAADQFVLYRDHGTFPWRADAFEQHLAHCQAFIEKVTHRVNTGTAWARAVQ